MRRLVDGQRRRAAPDGEAARHRGRRGGGQRGRRRGGEGGVLAEPAEAGLRARAGHRLVPELVEETHSDQSRRARLVGPIVPWTYARVSEEVVAEEGKRGRVLPRREQLSLGVGADDDRANCPLGEGGLRRIL